MDDYANRLLAFENIMFIDKASGQNWYKSNNSRHQVLRKVVSKFGGGDPTAYVHSIEVSDADAESTRTYVKYRRRSYRCIRERKGR
jgi:hypothetical protein